MNKEGKKKLNRQQTKKLVPAIKAFNKMAKVFINLLNKKIEAKEQKLNSIRVLVGNTPIPTQKSHNISIQTLDLNKTMVRKKGEGGYNQRMDWEKDLKNRNRGFIL